ncbi:MAG: flippase-like domain-containing protein [Rhodobacteraceae bacterium]|nr:flippase-like domain-containing protein [Paracoccaceae bacterium]
MAHAVTGGATARRWAGPSWRRLLTGAVVVSVLVLLVLAIALSPWEQVTIALAAANWGVLALALAASLVVYPLWVWQWRHIAAPLRIVRWPVMAQVVALSIGARFTISGLGGVASGGAALHTHAGLTAAEAASVMTVDQILAGGTKLLVLVLALAMAPVPAPVRNASLVLGAALGVACLLLAGLGRFRRALRSALGARLGAAVARFAGDLGRLGSVRVVLPAALLAVLKKGLEIASAYAIQRALGIDGTPALAILAVASVSLVSLLPLAPVHLGPQALAVFTTYAALGTPAAEAISVAVLHQAMMLVSTLIIGAAGLAVATCPARAKTTP